MVPSLPRPSDSAISSEVEFAADLERVDTVEAVLRAGHAKQELHTFKIPVDNIMASLLVLVGIDGRMIWPVVFPLFRTLTLGGK